MSDSPVRRNSRSPSPWRAQSRSRSRSPRPKSRSPRPKSRSPRAKSRSPRPRSRSPRPRSRSRSLEKQRPRSCSRSRGRSRSRSPEDRNGGNTLYVTGLSSRVTERDLEEHFAKEGKVASCFLVVEPRTRISRGFAFITMDTVEDANRCVKYLNQSVLEGRYITVERSRRKRPRTPTPGHYLGLKSTRDRDYGHRGGDRGRYRGGGGGGSGRDDYQHRRSPRRSPYRGGRDYSPRRSSPYAGRSRRERSRSLPYSPYASPDRRYARGSR
ncbi:serine/arginine-rich splicing factor SR45a [Lotus japonicus]|uniref:serine/arginine-rich splicing factor SR45a n=1 Tax=Lotus japonicus TaxID=34305 RepID=UPI002588283D|nr:serine/arginine-rich splicing factor SR45a [Lotus japonicus]